MTAVLSNPVGHPDISSKQLRHWARECSRAVGILAGGFSDPHEVARVAGSLRETQSFLTEEAKQQASRELIAAHLREMAKPKRPHAPVADVTLAMPLDAMEVLRKRFLFIYRGMDNPSVTDVLRQHHARYPADRQRLSYATACRFVREAHRV